MRRKNWTIAHRETISRRAKEIMGSAEFRALPSYRQATALVWGMQSLIPAEFQRRDVQLAQLSPDVKARLRGAHRELGSPVFANGTLMTVLSSGEAISVPAEHGLGVQQTGDLFVQPATIQPTAAVPPAEEVKPAAGPDLLGMLDKLRPKELDLQALALEIAALLPQPQPVEVRVEVPIQIPAHVDRIAAADTCTADELLSLYLRKVLGEADPRLAFAKSVRAAAAGEVPQKRMLEVKPERPGGKIRIKVLHLDGTQFETFEKQLREAGVRDLVELTQSVTADCEFCVSHYLEVSHHEAGRVKAQNNLNNATYVVRHGVTSCAQEVIKYVDSQLK